MAQNNWDFDSGNLVLDFANTAEFHASNHPEEMINSYTDLVSWAEAGGIVSNMEAKTMLARSRKEPDIAARVLGDALELRELIYRIFSALAGNKPPYQADLDEFNKILAESLRHARITKDEEVFTWNWLYLEDSFEGLLWPIAWETANLLTSREINRIGECADDRGCGYLFIDTSRNHSRRWCSMEACGNRAKAQRHYQKISTNRSSR